MVVAAVVRVVQVPQKPEMRRRRDRGREKERLGNDRDELSLRHWPRAIPVTWSHSTGFPSNGSVISTVIRRPGIIIPYLSSKPSPQGRPSALPHPRLRCLPCRHVTLPTSQLPRGTVKETLIMAAFLGLHRSSTKFKHRHKTED